MTTYTQAHLTIINLLNLFEIINSNLDNHPYKEAKLYNDSVILYNRRQSHCLLV